MKTENRKQKTENRKQKTEKILCMALVSTLLAACSSSSGGGNAIRPPAIDEIPEPRRDEVIKEKTVNLVEEYPSGSTYRYTIDRQTGEYDFSSLPNGRTNKAVSLSYENPQGTTANLSGTMLIYQQPYSVVTGITWTRGSGDIAASDEQLNVFRANSTLSILGLSTPADAFTELAAKNATFDYKGAAFDGQEQATLSYRVNFRSREGGGAIEGFTRTGRIDLQLAKLEFYNGNSGFINGDARIEKASSDKQEARYYLSFFGPNAEEIAGEIYDSREGGFLEHSQIIFAGKRETN